MAKLENKKSYQLEGLADTVADWITDNCEPDEVFDEKVICDWIVENYEPQQVFDDDALERWAVENGYKKEGE